jgi:DNA repair protein SbcC/Rad50
MRPIVMDMNGFASFREATRVDFTDADFFALVGPTGAGKSTVIDAMTFALYGSVPRWGRKGMVSLALAPTVARATVKLVFEVDRQRYVVARELRRTGSQVSQRAASLERIIDPDGVAGKDDKTTPMARDLAGVTAAVERLLGLSYEDFIQCVVLPQGQFADFLHAKPADRQEILLRLLGAEHYKQMMMKANQRASAAGQRAETIGESLLTYADATEESEKQSRAAEEAVAGLADRVAGTLPRIAERQAQVSDTEDRLQRLRADHTALSVLRVPDGTRALDADLAAGRTEVAGLKNAEQEAEHADTAARESLAAGPQRAPLQLARERRNERNRLHDSIPGLEATAARLAAQAEEASAAVDTGAAGLEDLRVQRDKAAKNATTAGEQVTRLEREHATLAAVTVPDGVAVLDDRRQAAATAVADAYRAVSAAEQADTAAREARDRAAPEVPLAQASRDLTELRGLLAELETARHTAEYARAAQASAETVLANAMQVLTSQRTALEEAQRAHVIAGLRPHLVTGKVCPLCEQTVAVLPAAMTVTEVDDARSSLTEAEGAENAAQNAVKKVGGSVASAEAELKTKAARKTSLVASLGDVLTGPLAGTPLPATRLVAGIDTAGPRGAVIAATFVDSALAETGALIRERDKLDQAATKTAKETEAARLGHQAAQAAEQQADADVSAARDALRAARDPLVQLGALQVDATSLAAGWTALVTWAADQQRARAADLAAAREAATAAASQHRAAITEFGDAEQALTRLRDEANIAVRADQQAKTKLGQVTERLTELGELLKDAPDDNQITAQLAMLGQLEEAAAKAGEALRAARADRAKGETVLAALQRAEATARAELSAARDRVVALGAPALETLGLNDAWTTLVTWAVGQAAVREQQVQAASAELGSAQAAVRQLTGQLTADLAEAGIEMAPEVLVSGATSAVAAALERARAATERIGERRAEAAGLRSKQQAAQDEQQVAGLLGDLLRANNFQRWLVNAAVDDLVAEASATLSALSSSQFDLVYDDGDFYVIDHADADARRSVRTLSGGETFQASLALALALSSQISALAAAGAARLDSIFLDEGFGTLDPETLEVVATTLETLAQGERMVGVVTHVPALAERVPVRFRVTRNARSSTITREGFGIAAEEEVMA